MANPVKQLLVENKWKDKENTLRAEKEKKQRNQSHNNLPCMEEVEEIIMNLKLNKPPSFGWNKR